MVRTLREQSKQKPAWFRSGWLREDYSRQAGNVPVVDEEAGIIRGLKMCGLQSDNGRDYDPSCLRMAVPLYEGKPCYVNHCTTQRDVRDDIGVWRNCRFLEGQGIFGDLHYDKESADAKRLVDRAKRLHENVGFSHDAKTDPKYIELRGNRPTVVRIEEIKSIDYVAGPATADGLFEGKTVATVRNIYESLKLKGNRAKWRQTLFEMDGAAGAASAEVADGGGIEDAFQAAVAAIMSDGSMSPTDKASAISTWAKAHEKITSKPEPEAPVVEADGEAEGEKKMEEACDPEKKTMEQRLARFERKEAVENLCESLKFTASKDQINKLILCEAVDIQKELISAWKAAKSPAPQSKSSHDLKEHTADDTAKSDKYRKLCLVG